MSYSYDSRVGFSMVDKDQKLLLTQVIDYFQDAATFHSEDLGVGLSYLVERNLVWVLNAWQIDVYKLPKYLDRIKITTNPYKFRGFLGYRNFTIEDETGKALVKANSMWSLINISTGKPAVAPEELPGIYGQSEALEMDYCNGKILVPENAKELTNMPVAKHFLDPNGHMNNGQYVRLAYTLLPEDFKIARLRTEYRSQAFLGDTLHLVCASSDGKFVVSIQNDAGKPFSVIEFSSTF